MAATRVGNRRGAERVAFGGYDLLQLVAVTRLGGVHRGESNDASKPRVPLAIKWLKPEHSRDPAIAVCFTDVMARARRLEHAGVCAIVDIDRAPDESLFAALEWVDGKDWKRIVATLKKQGTTMPPTLVAYIGMRAAQALEAAHRPSPNRQLAPLYHGELSGADILIGYDGRVKLVGLGSAELAAAAQLPAVRTAFRAPELARGAACSAQSDVFSLGACLYQALTLASESIPRGPSAEATGTQSMIRHIVPAALLEIVRKAVAEDPGTRFGSAGELARALAQWASTQSLPGDAHALSAFMTSMFEQTRSGPMNDPRDRTPAQPARARRLAAMTRAPAPEDSVATTPAPVSPVGEPRASAAKPMAAPAPIEPLRSVGEPTAAPAPRDESWESEPWDDSHGAENVWSVAPAAPAVITTRPPARPAASVPSPQTLAPATPVLAAQREVPSLFIQTETSPRAAWRVPAFVAASVVVVMAVLFALRVPEPAPELRPKVAAPALVAAPQVEPAAAELAQIEQPGDQVSASAAAVPVAAPVAATATRTPRALTGDSEPRRVGRLAPAPSETARDDDRAKDAPSAVSSDHVEDPEPTAPDETWTPPTRPAIAAAPMPPPAPSHAAVAETPAAPAPRSSPNASVVRPAEAIAQPSPDFPTRAKRRGVTEGAVTVEYTVDETGAVRDPRVVESHPKGLFDDATLSALQRWRYRPKLVDGKPVTSRRSFTFHFQ